MAGSPSALSTGRAGTNRSRTRQNSPMLGHAELTRLEESLDHIRAAPGDSGSGELIARRPAEDEREVLTEARLDLTDGLVGDTWRARGSSRTTVGSDNPDAQFILLK